MLKNCPIVGSFSGDSIRHTEEEGQGLTGLVPLVPHWRQRYCWDCGIACCYMILSYYGLQLPVDELYEKFWTQSVWTIDLVHLLHEYGLQLTYYTITWGVRLDYCKHEFYQPHFQDDKTRVERLFGLAKSKNLKIQKKSVSLEELKKRLRRIHFRRNCLDTSGIKNNVENRELLLLLVDKRLLKCKLCERKTSLMSWLKKLCYPSFLGHYIILWGYCPEKDTFWYSDPASCQGMWTLVPMLVCHSSF